MSPSSTRAHQRIGLRLLKRWSAELEKSGCQHCELLYEIDWIAAVDSVFRPDLLITCDGEDSPFLQKPPVLIAEILSPSTRSRDLVYKREAYEALGVRYYLTLDPETRVTTLLELREGRLQESQDRRLRIHHECEITLDLDNLYA